MRDDEQLQRDLTRLALGALEGHSFVLAGSGAIREHGLVDRLTHDVDLFTNSYDPASFSRGVDLLEDALRVAGYDVDERRRTDLFAQLTITTPDGRAVDMDLGYDWREREPTTHPLGPVLNVEDAVASKLNALYTRQETRDYIDVDSIRASGRFTDAELLDATARRDDGFVISMLIPQLEKVAIIDASQFAEYGLDPAAVDALKSRFAAWAEQLRSPAPDTSAQTPPLAQERAMDAPDGSTPRVDPDEALRARLRAVRDSQYRRGADTRTTPAPEAPPRRTGPMQGPQLGR